MTKEEWQDLHDKLKKILSDFQDHYYDYKHGSNRKIRDTAGRKVDSAINLADLYITKSVDAYQLLTGENGDNYSRAINYDEFKQSRYFGGDLSKFLERIQKKIEELAD